MTRNRSRLDKIEAAIAAARYVPPEIILEVRPGETEAEARDRYAECGRPLAPSVIVVPSEAENSAEWQAEWGSTAKPATEQHTWAARHFATEQPQEPKEPLAGTWDSLEPNARPEATVAETEASPSDDPRGAALLPGTVAGHKVIW